MSTKILTTLAALILLLAPAALAQTNDRTMPLRTPDGQPDVSGIFENRSMFDRSRAAR